MLKKWILLTFLFLSNNCAFANINSEFVGSPSTNLVFEENKGQITGEDSKLVNYFLKDKNTTIFILKTGIAYQFSKVNYKPKTIGKGMEFSFDDFAFENKIENIETYRMDIELIGANKNAKITVNGKSKDYTHYYNHNVFNVHNYTKIIYHNIYPSIDWIIYQDQGSLKYDFIVRPNGDISKIKMLTKWVENKNINSDGSLTLSNIFGEISEKKPISYQDEKEVNTTFRFKGDTICFELDKYDKTKTLTIDPTLEWATYYGGSNYDAFGNCVADSNGNIYAVGGSNSFNNIAIGGYQNTHEGNGDGILVKFNSKGQRLWATYYGGDSSDNFSSISIDKNINLYISGNTRSLNNISLNGHQNTIGGDQDGFLVKFDSTGKRIWGTYYGGNNRENVSYSCIDDFGNVFVTGDAFSSNNIFYKGHRNSVQGSEAFLVKFDNTGKRIWGTYYGGTSSDGGRGCYADKDGNIYLTGSTLSTSGIAFNGYKNTSSLSSEAYLVKFDSTGKRIWGTYYGGANPDFGGSCAVDNLGNVYLYGVTNSTSGIAHNGHQNTAGGNLDVYLVKFDKTGKKRFWGTYYGGTGSEYIGGGISIDKFYNIYMSSPTNSPNNISYKGHQNTLGGNFDAMLVKFDSTGKRIWGTYYGGLNDDFSGKCSIDKLGNIYLPGASNSNDNIAFKGFQNTNTGLNDAFLAKFTIKPDIEITISPNDTLCYGKVQTFNSTIMLGGTNPIYKWYKNNVLVGNDSFYIDSTLNNGDSISCLIIGNDPSLIIDSCFSNVITVSVLFPDTAFKNKAICDGENYIFNNQSLTSSGTYWDTLQNQYGCDSFIVLNLAVGTNDTIVKYDTTCSNIPYFFNGLYLYSNITLKDTLPNRYGCDSFVTLHLHVKKSDTTDIFTTICEGDSYSFFGNSYTTTGIYSHTLKNQVKCDSLIRLFLSVNRVSRITMNESICHGSSFYFKNQFLTSTGMYLDTLKNSTNCDSFVELNLSVQPNYDITVDTTICFNEQYNGYYISGTYRDSFQSIYGCDSFVTLNLTVTDPPTKDTQSHFHCSQVTINNRTYFQSGIVNEVVMDENNCDSIYRTHILDFLGIIPRSLPPLHLNFCDSTSYKDKTIYGTGLHRDTVRSIQKPYCDSIYQAIFFTKLERPTVNIVTGLIGKAVVGQIVQLQTTNFNNYLWNTGENTQSISLQVNKDTIVYLTAWDYEGCENSDSIFIGTRDKMPIGLPNSFSPNGDGLNDYFEANGLNEDYHILDFSIFNRWGEKVYQYSVNNPKWNGIYKNKIVPIGIYYYYLSYRFIPFQKITETKGVLNVLY